MPARLFPGNQAKAQILSGGNRKARAVTPDVPSCFPQKPIMCFAKHSVPLVFVFLLALAMPMLWAEPTPTATPGDGEAVELYISPTGDDANPGTRASPFQSLERARDAARQFKHNRKVTVWLRGGVYELEKPFELTTEDSGSEGAAVVYRGWPDEEVRIVGGKTVTGWEPVSDEEVLRRLAPQARGNVVQADLKAIGVTAYGEVKGGGLELFFEDKPMTLARWPNDGFIDITGLVEPDTLDVRGTKGSTTGKFFYAGDRPKRWAGEKDLWVHGYWFWDWSDERQKVESIDAEQHIISVSPPYHSYGYRVGQWFYAFNILAELDTPGEWYLNRETGILYFWPPTPIKEGPAIVSVLDTLVNFTEVSHVVFQDVIFEAARGTAIKIKGGSQTRIAGCVLRNLGGWAVQIEGGAKNGVVGCDIYQTGSGGIGLNGHGIYQRGESGIGRKTLTPAGHFADNNHIHHYGRWNRMYGAAISMAGVGNRATHNLIHDAPHMAIEFSGNDHLIEFNEIYNVCQESNDAGAIYAGRDWTMRGTVIRHNYLHHINGFQGRGSVGIYLDDMFSGTEIYGNVFYLVTQAVFIGGGRDCIVENNLFVDCQPALHIDARAMNWASSHVDATMTERLNAMPYKSDLWRKRYPELVNILDEEPSAPKGNVVARNVSFGGQWDNIEDEARPHITVKDNLIDQDPLFEDKPPQSFHLQATSPAYAIGFKPIPFERIGLVVDQYRSVVPPTLIPRAGVFVDNLTVALSCRTPDAVIRYTLDGKEPTGNSPTYAPPLVLTSSCTLRAAAFVGDQRSGIVEANYTSYGLGPTQPLPVSLLPVVASDGYCPPKLSMNMEGRPITLRGEVFPTGVFVHPGETHEGGRGFAEFALVGGLARATRFKATIGVEDTMQDRGSAVFLVYIRRDGTWQQAHESGILRGGGEIKEVDVDITRADALRLVVTDAGDGIWSDHAVWANARLE